MANTTNFGWETPDDTDLVKDGAAAMRTLGNAIDASLVDLKGGTTGQVLSKASNTDLDYSWVTPELGDITAVTVSSPITGGGTTGSVNIAIQDGTTAQKGAVQLEDSTSSTSITKAATPNSVKTAYDLANGAIAKSIVDAKADLITATAADTPARLAVGANDLILTAASGETTGLKWAGSGVTYTPTITGNSTFTLGNGTLNGRYVQVGKTVTAMVNLVCGSTTVLPTSFTYISIPVTAQNTYAVGAVHYEDTPAGLNYENNVILADTGKALLFTPAATSANSGFLNSTSPFTFGSGDLIRMSITYEAA